MVRTEREGDVTTVILSRPKQRNAVDRATAEGLADAFREFENGDAKVAVLWGEGGNFCAGADLKAFDNRLEETGDGPMGPSRMVLSKPVIAAITGFAVAGGLELACWCDLRVAEEDATLGVFCRRFGVPLIDGGTIRLPRLIGMSRALDLILTGRAVNAQEALDIGLVNRLAPNSRKAAEELARQLASFPQDALRGDRRSAYEQWELPLEAALDNEFRLGRLSLPAARDGAHQFTKGSGRHGQNF